MWAHNPQRKQNLTRFFPGDVFVLEGQLDVFGNNSGLRPVLYISAAAGGAEYALISQSQPAPAACHGAALACRITTASGGYG